MAVVKFSAVKGAVALILVCVGVYVFGLDQLRAIKQGTEEIVLENEAESRFASEMRRAVSVRVTALRNMVLKHDATDHKRELDTYRTAEREYSAARMRLNEVFSRSNGTIKDEFAALENADKEVRSAVFHFEEVIDLVEQKKFDAAALSLLEKVFPLQQRWNESLLEIERIEAQQNDAILQQNAHAHLKLLIAFSVLLIVPVAGGVLFILRRK